MSLANRNVSIRKNLHTRDPGIHDGCALSRVHGCAERASKSTGIAVVETTKAQRRLTKNVGNPRPQRTLEGITPRSSVLEMVYWRTADTLPLAMSSAMRAKSGYMTRSFSIVAHTDRIAA